MSCVQIGVKQKIAPIGRRERVRTAAEPAWPDRDSRLKKCYDKFHSTSVENRLKHPGALITFEGLDGCGKTTQLELEVERLRAQDRLVLATKEPGGTRVGQQIRELVLDGANGPLAASTELALMLAARAQHIQEVICPALERGGIVLCDRFTDSTIAYQGYGRGIPLDDIDALNRLLCHGVRPDLTLLLDIDAETAARRTGSRNRAALQRNSRFEEEGLEFFRRVRQGYLEIARREPQRVRVVDGMQSMHEVHDRISGLVDEFLAKMTASASRPAPKGGRSS